MKNVSDIYPLSPMQELMLVHAISRARNDLLFNQLVFSVEGDMDAVTYERCWSEMVQRHPMLRTMFLWEGLKSPVQVVRETVELDWQNQDWRDIPNQAQEEQLQKLLQDDRERGINLTQAPLMRFILCRRSEDVYTLIWSSHHIIMDRWCTSILISETTALYEAKRTGVSAKLETRRPFRDYISWLQQQETRDAQNFWRDELADINQPTRLGEGAPPGADFSFSEQKELLASHMTAMLRKFAATHRVTLSTVVMGAWALLHALANPHRDLLLGVTISGRPSVLPGVEGIIGPFINNVPLRVSFPFDQPVIAWLQALQDHQQAIQTYGYVSPLQIQEWSEIPGSTALYETLFLYQSPVKLPASRLQMRVVSATLHTNFPLTLAVEEEPEGLLLWIIYAQKRFAPAAISRLLEQMQSALDLICTQPDSTPNQLIEQLRGIYPHTDSTPMVEEFTQTEPAAGHQPPRNGLEARLFKIWSNLLEHQAFGVQDDFFTLGGTSLMAMRMFAIIEKQFNVSLPLSLLFSETTILQLSARISEHQMDDEILPVLVPIQPQGSKAPLFCVHGVEGGVLGYRDLANALGDDQPFFGLQAISLEEDESMDLTIEAMASRYIDAMRAYQPQGPYRIGGYCFGGVVAYEMACQLEKIGETVSLLAVFEGALPEANEQHVSISQRLGYFLESIPHWIKDYTGMPAEQLMMRIRTTLKRLWTKYRGNPAAQRQARAEEILDTDIENIPGKYIELTNVNSDSFLKYKPQKYHGNITVYRARIRSINEVLFSSLDPKMGWDNFTVGQVNVKIVDGFHRNIHLEPYVGSLAVELTKSLEGD